MERHKQIKNREQFIELPKRSAKPRTNGITMLIDGGIGLGAIKDTLDIGQEFIDYAKLGWGTALITQKLKEKIELYHSFDIPVCLGGTFFELAHVKNKVADFKSFLKEYGIKIVEISDGTIDLKRNEKLKYIEEFAKDFDVYSEYGNKDATKKIIAPYHWVTHIKEELESGAQKVIAEGRESGTAGMYRGTAEVRTGLIDEIVNSVSPDKMIWEAPKKEQQIWFIKTFGTNVNLGNIAFKDVIPLETLRLGLRSDTLLFFHDGPEAKKL